MNTITFELDDDAHDIIVEALNEVPTSSFEYADVEDEEFSFSLPEGAVLGKIEFQGVITKVELINNRVWAKFVLNMREPVDTGVLRLENLLIGNEGLPASHIESMGTNGMGVAKLLLGTCKRYGAQEVFLMKHIKEVLEGLVLDYQ